MHIKYIDTRLLSYRTTRIADLPVKHDNLTIDQPDGNLTHVKLGGAVVYFRFAMKTKGKSPSIKKK